MIPCLPSSSSSRLRGGTSKASRLSELPPRDGRLTSLGGGERSTYVTSPAAILDGSASIAADPYWRQRVEHGREDKIGEFSRGIMCFWDKDPIGVYSNRNRNKMNR